MTSCPKFDGESAEAHHWTPCEAWDGKGKLLPKMTREINLHTGLIKYLIQRIDRSYHEIEEVRPLPITIHRLHSFEHPISPFRDLSRERDTHHEH